MEYRDWGILDLTQIQPKMRKYRDKSNQKVQP